MTDAPKRPNPDANEMAGEMPAETGRISRRGLLAGSAGLTLGSLALAGKVRAEHDHGTGAAGSTSMPGPSGSLSQRAYSLPPSVADDVAHDPASLPPPLTRREPQTVRVELETIEKEAMLDERATFRYWTFNGTVPGPFVRVRVGDTVEVTLRNAEDSWMPHNVDFHACTGPGGGAEATTAFPGEEKSFRFKALKPGLYVYHCAVPPVALHIANGMFGLILVEPEEGLPPVDREFYVMQGEIYTHERFGTSGLLTEDYEKMINERPEYFVLNGHVGALTEHFPMKAKVGETVRIYFGVGGPNFVSSFHVIGEIFDRVYVNGSVTSPPQEDVQTVLVPAGGATIVEMKLEVPGRYVLVDHSLSRVERGLAGWLDVEGEENPEVFAELE
ncbi:copper-containing nitrite reductase [Aquibaculum sediminis]|uniref:copper-containing nitrite reductase n=1 Tax=Aquibaculum sediminis TaxID=3231907 RepID=UPI00345627D4